MEFDKWESLHRKLLINHFKTYDKDVVETDETYRSWAELRWKDSQSTMKRKGIIPDR